jgi:hypothetical protein
MALRAADPHAAEIHRKLQRTYLERASVGDRPQMELPHQVAG